jgi:hypothetical protein
MRELSGKLGEGNISFGLMEIRRDSQSDGVDNKG